MVTGLREWTNKRVMWDRLRQYPPDTILIHGAACGADLMAVRCGEVLGFNIHSHPYYGDLGKAGGEERNRCMFGALLNQRRFGFHIFVEAFPLRPAGGTRNMIKLVKKYNERTPVNVPLWVYDPA